MNAHANAVEDADLLARISAGDQHALELLHERFASGMYSVAMRATRSERLSQEAVQGGILGRLAGPAQVRPCAPFPGGLAVHPGSLQSNRRRPPRGNRQTAEADLELYEAPDNVHDEVRRGFAASD
jgi:hypothetical protein